MKSNFSNEDLLAIEKTLMSVESQTEGEIVPMVVTKCCTTGHVKTCMLLIGLIFIFALEQFHFPVWIFATSSVAILILNYFLSSFKMIERFFTPKADQKKMVEARAFYEFYQNGVYLTENKIGVLIFLSLFEKRAVILADQGIAQKLDPSVWQNILNELTQHAGQKQLSAALIQAITRVGEVLKNHFPSHAESRNELKNQLLIKD